MKSKLLLNPFNSYSEKKLLMVGGILSAISIFLAVLFNARRDGVIDVHFVGNVSIATAILDHSINVVLLAVLLFGAGKMINSKTRFIDILNPALISLTVFLLLFFFNTGDFMYSIGANIMEDIAAAGMPYISTEQIIFMLLFSLVSISLLIWFFIILYSGFKVACNAKKTKHILLFAVAVLIAEVLSKVLIYYFV